MATNFVADVKNWKEPRRNQHGGKDCITRDTILRHT